MTPGRAPQKSRKRSRAAVAHWRRGRESLAAEFLCQQAPSIAITMTLGCAIALVEYGYIPGNGRPFQTAGVAVAIWRLIWMGVWTGYTMALVGQAAGIFALPYSTSVLGSSNPHVTPTMLVLTFISPFGALPGFRRSGQWNPALAAAVCPGGAIGALTGPFRSGYCPGRPRCLSCDARCCSRLVRAATVLEGHTRFIAAWRLGRSRLSGRCRRQPLCNQDGVVELDVDRNSFRKISAHIVEPAAFSCRCRGRTVFVGTWGRRRLPAGSDLCDGLSHPALCDGGCDDSLYCRAVVRRNSDIHVCSPGVRNRANRARMVLGFLYRRGAGYLVHRAHRKHSCTFPSTS